MNRFYKILFASVATIFIVPTLPSCKPTEADSRNQTGLIATPRSQEKIYNIAKSITVAVFVDQNRTSGILISKEGQEYTVLTNAHVITPGKLYPIQTPDGKIYAATLINQVDSLQGEDLALLQFSAVVDYSVAAQGRKQDLALKQKVYAAGFPSESDTFNFTTGEISLLSEKPLKGGYEIGVSNKIEQGMSGGPLLNQKGKLIGVNGLGNFAVLNDAYTFEDGTSPSDEQLQTMRQASWAVPIETLVAIQPSRKSQETKTNILTGLAAEIDAIAEKITVRINLKEGNGSGVIIAQQGDTYYVLTAGHVLEDQTQYHLIAPDGKKYTPEYGKTTILGGVDLAVLQFKSQETYPVATLANFNLKTNKKKWVFVSGFPGSSSQRQFTAGMLESKARSSIGLKDEASLIDAQDRGYELAYSNLSKPGMSGGPVLDSRGYLIGINAYGEEDTIENKAGDLVPIHIGKSLGVPTRTLLGLTSKAKIQSQWLKIETTVPADLTTSEIASIQDSLFPLERPESNTSAIEWFQYGNQIWRIGRFDDAVAAFNVATKKNPNFYQAYYLKGLVLRYQGKYEEALASYQKVIDIDPGFYQAWREKGLILGELLQKYPEALAAINKAIELNPEDFQLYAQKGYVLNNLERYEDAINAYDRALALNDNSALIYNNRGNAYAELEQYQRALADYSKAIEINPQFAGAYYNRGFIYATLEQYQRALADYSKAIEINPQFAEAYHNRGLIYAELEQYQRALADLTKAIEINPQDAEAYNNRGNIYTDLGQYRRALADYGKAIEINPQYASAYNNRGFIYATLEQYQRALADLTKAIEINPQFAGAYYNRGFIYATLEQYQSATENIEKAAHLFLQQNDTAAYQNAQKLIQLIQQQAAKNYWIE
ncbi:MAG: tetratricopeptide repeat-containing serine protease family protein [Xenococcus sp. (in: cyanobacteria)]